MFVMQQRASTASQHHGYVQINYSPTSTLHQTHFASLLFLFALFWLATLSACHQTISLPLEGQLLFLHTAHTAQGDMREREKDQSDGVEWLNKYCISSVIRILGSEVQHEIHIFGCLDRVKLCQCSSDEEEDCMHLKKTRCSSLLQGKGKVSMLALLSL